MQKIETGFAGIMAKVDRLDQRVGALEERALDVLVGDDGAASTLKTPTKTARKLLVDQEVDVGTPSRSNATTPVPNQCLTPSSPLPIPSSLRNMAVW